MMRTMVPTPMYMSNSGFYSVQAACSSSLVVVVVTVGPETVVRRRLAELRKPPQELQKASDVRNPTPPTIIKITPIMWRLNPVEVTDTAKRMIAPAATTMRLNAAPMTDSLLSTRYDCIHHR